MVQLVNNHVLLPHPINWAQDPQWQRRWETGLAGALTGAESRQAMRSAARQTLAWLVTPTTLQEQGHLDDRIRAARKSGLACAPFWGRGSELAADVVDTAVTVTGSIIWPWIEGDYIFFLDRERRYDVRQIEESDGIELTLSQAVTRTYAAGLLAWPLIFGRFDSEDMSAVTNWHGAVELSIAERVSPASVTIGAFVPSGAVGIGVMIVGSTNQVA